MQLSIVMPTRNAERLIGEALASVEHALAGTGAMWEILIADGSSSDNTIAIASSVPHVRIVSREDSGLYDGINRAIAAASKDWVIILNSDDFLLTGGVTTALQILIDHPGLDMVTGSAMIGTHEVSARLIRPDRDLTVEGAMFGIPAINARIYRRDTLMRAGPIMTNVGLAADREWLFRVASVSGTRARASEPLYFYRQHAGSQTLANDFEAALRIYLADMLLAERLASAEPANAVEKTAWSADVRRLAEAAYALAWTKAGVRGRNAILAKGMGRQPSFPALLRGLRATLRWRGRMSGS